MYSVSVCAPAFNEGDGIRGVLQSWVDCLEKAMHDEMITDYEVIICDDGSQDATVQEIESLENSKVKVIENSRNLGPGIAIRNAIKASCMEFVITIDSDGQFQLKEAVNWIKGVSLDTSVLGYRQKSDKILLRFGSVISTQILRFGLSTKIPDGNCMLKLIPGNLARNLDLRAVGLNYSGEMTFLICTSQTKVTWERVSHNRRVFGKSSARLLRDGFKRVIFLIYLIFGHALVKKNVISTRKDF